MWTPSTAIRASAKRVSGESHGSESFELALTHLQSAHEVDWMERGGLQMALHHQTLDRLDPECACVCVAAADAAPCG